MNFVIFQVFDREGDDGKSVPVTIKAIDSGEPSLEGVCSFSVEITDVNDNPPLFDRQKYIENVKQVKIFLSIRIHTWNSWDRFFKIFDSFFFDISIKKNSTLKMTTEEVAKKRIQEKSRLLTFTVNVKHNTITFIRTQVYNITFKNLY